MTSNTPLTPEKKRGRPKRYANAAERQRAYRARLRDRGLRVQTRVVRADDAPLVPSKLAEPTFDADGYPTEETLAAITQWPGTECKSLLKFVRKAWRYPEFFRVAATGDYCLSTGGWSGNEDLVQAMRRNFVFWGICWLESRRGGHFKFRLPQRKAAALASKG